MLAVLLAIVVPSCASGPESIDLSDPLDALFLTEAGDWLALADDAESRLAWQEAAYCLDRWAMDNDHDEAWMYRRVDAAVQMEDVDTSARYRELLLAVHPDDLLLRVNLAQDLQRLNRGLEGSMLLEAVLGGGAPPADVLLALADLHRNDKRWIEAAEAYERLAQSNPPEGARWWQAASQMRERGGDLLGATAALEQALAQSDLGEGERRSLERLKAFQMGEPQNEGDAKDLLLNHPEASFRLRGAEFLSRIDFEQEVAVFSEALSDTDMRVVQVALMELGSRLQPGQGAVLYGLLNHSDPAVAVDALQALARVAVRADVEALLVQLVAADRSRFRMARKGLEAATGHIIGNDLDPNEERRQVLRQLWLNWWSETGKHLE